MKLKKADSSVNRRRFVDGLVPLERSARKVRICSDVMEERSISPKWF
jgi:hypothetical protein